MFGEISGAIFSSQGVMFLIVFVLTLYIACNLFFDVRVPALEKRAVLITGCDSGFGYELAKKLLRCSGFESVCRLSHFGRRSWTEDIQTWCYEIQWYTDGLGSREIRPSLSRYWISAREKMNLDLSPQFKYMIFHIFICNRRNLLCIFAIDLLRPDKLSLVTAVTPCFGVLQCNLISSFSPTSMKRCCYVCEINSSLI